MKFLLGTVELIRLFLGEVDTMAYWCVKLNVNRTHNIR